MAGPPAQVELEPDRQMVRVHITVRSAILSRVCGHREDFFVRIGARSAITSIEKPRCEATDQSQNKPRPCHTCRVHEYLLVEEAAHQAVTYRPATAATQHFPRKVFRMRQLVNWFRRPARASRPSSRRNRLTRPLFEALEDRNLLAVYYGGGPLLQHVQIETVFYGDQWYYNSALYQSAVNLDGYFNDITQSSYMDLLNEYGVGRGNFEDGVINLGNPPRGSVVDDSEIQNMLDAGIRRGYFDAPSPNQLYFVFTTPNVLVTLQGADSQHQFLGYHNAFYDPALGSIYYAVIPHPIGNADI